MSMEEKSGYCKTCDKQTLVRRKGTNHILHLLLSIVTGGVWIIVWILAAMTKDNWRCSQCGGTKIKGVS